jgi:LRR receptor-like serine/threonine-protein kinase FLS2
MEKIKVGNNLMGSLPSELGLLQDLTSIQIFGENLSGSLPESLQNLRKMRLIYLINTMLTGSFPSWIGEWSNLAVASFSSNMLTGSIPTAVASLTDLTFFSVDDNVMTGNLDPLHSLTNLISLFLDDNSFQGVIDDSFFRKHSYLVNLDMSTNELKGRIPTHLMSSNTLQILDLHGNQFTELPDTIPRNNSLLFLAIYDNPLIGPFPNKTLSHWKKLLHLDISATSFSGTMPEAIGALTQLTYLFMASTNFQRGTIPDSYQHLTNLQDISLQDSQRTGVSRIDSCMSFSTHHLRPCIFHVSHFETYL